MTFFKIYGNLNVTSVVQPEFSMELQKRIIVWINIKLQRLFKKQKRVKSF